MKLASHLHEGRPSWGVVLPDGLVDGCDLLGDQFLTIRALLAGGALGALRDALPGPCANRIPLSQVGWLPTLPDPGKILCVGLNYRDHVSEVSRDLPPQPSVFVRLGNTLLPHGGSIVRPRASAALDFEGELAVVIGKAGRHIVAAEALSHVAGYTCFNDVSVRDFQKHSVGAGKNFHATGPLGPWMVTSDEILDPTELSLTTRLNGQVVQHARTDTLIYGIPQIIAYLSRITPLEAGDVIATGTPAGVGSGRKPPLWMKAGDLIEVEVQGIGVLSNRVVDEDT
jgi:2-keto-4-pentenoate hydratase/2-oxohepta-3-ene-1,7-dioic acid hydratase in catechol pathway